ncbi:MAG: family oxidoreductase [Fluviicola sp.]|jgi:short-subunit dehydrogenase|uniref:SDR family NAD(P)-dependent oxidoreductase n=1 Tax=Fluviicola sp. TaxID=1917219 RepID=UPI0026236B3F|nr:SDR family oxidoreductase [Fluviicola sp.]MDF3026635.1 family oxidoreductase [Fluviicola sp.]
MNYTLITGASSGIGEAVAKEFASKKHKLILVARSEGKLQQLCKELSSSYGIRTEYIVADLSRVDASREIFDECQKRNLQVDVLINNAGIGSSGEFPDNDLNTELDIIQINCTSLTALTHLFLQEMKARKSGTIINLGSLIAFIASPYMSVYAASKHFVKIFTYSIAEECKPYNVHVMFFSPGLTTSNFMNTKATNNAWGKSLTSNAATQTPGQVASELSMAFDQKKAFRISGIKNRRIVMLTRILPLRTIARIFSRQKQKQMGLIKS